MNDQATNTSREKRKQQLIYLTPSLKVQIDRERGKLTRSEWIERAIILKLNRDLPRLP